MDDATERLAVRIMVLPAAKPTLSGKAASWLST